MALALPKQEPVVLAKPKGDERSRIMRMKTALIMGAPFYGLLLGKLKLVEDASQTTAWTDSKSLGYNPAYVAGMSDAKLKGLLGHETLHCVNGHMWRRGTREHRLWNIACDYAIDQILQRGGFDVPNATINPAWAGWSAEQIYAVLLEEVKKEEQKIKQQRGQQQGNGSGQGQSQPQPGAGQGKPQGKPQPGAGGGQGEEQRSAYDEAIDNLFGKGPTKGETRDAPAESAIQDQSEWKQAISSAAAVAKSRGLLPADMEQLVEGALKSRVDWRSLTARFAQQAASLDYTWKSPSTRYAPMGLYLPRLKSEKVGKMVFGWDTSGSHYDKHTQEVTASEVVEIMHSVEPETLHVVYCDSKVQGSLELEPGDAPKWKPKGGGGTNFKPVFKWVEEQGIEPVAMIFMTDCVGEYPDEEPPYPVLWLSTIEPSKLAAQYIPPFGELVYLDLT
jgi:predicted metal-dependent peptidase